MPKFLSDADLPRGRKVHTEILTNLRRVVLAQSILRRLDLVACPLRAQWVSCHPSADIPSQQLNLNATSERLWTFHLTNRLRLMALTRLTGG